VQKEAEYIVSYKGLREGKHTFAFTVNRDFFSLIEESLYNDGDVRVNVCLNKGMRMLVFDFDIKGIVASVCDNCLEPINVPVSCQNTLYIKFGDEYDEPAEDIIILPHEEYKFDLKQVIYELIVTSLPMRHLHPTRNDGTTGCNPEMVEKLNEYKINKPHAGSEQTSDPRWDELKKLIDKKG
jgi:uncharacterized metal-binding protein YceD (DUF177 family)